MFPNKNPVPADAFSPPNRQMLRRCAVLMALFGVLLFALLMARLFQLQILEHERYERLAMEQQLRDAPTAARRGRICDAGGNPLAVSASVENVYLSPAEIQTYGEDPALIAQGLAEILGLDESELLQKCSQTGSWYVTVARKLEREQADEIRAFKNEYGLRGVRLETDTKRYYPNSSLACHLIGFVGTDNYGLEGIEARYDRVLAGTAGRTRRMTNAFGTDLLFEQFESFEPGQDGCDVSFLEVGAQAQARIDAAQSEEERQELLRTAQIRQWRNKALSDTYEPGSTFKIITLAMALEEGAVSESSSFFCPGSVSVKGRSSPIRCWKDGGHGSQDLTQAVQHSCNAAFVNIGLRIGAERFYDYCEAFGFLEKTGNPDDNLSAVTGIDLSGESGSIWWSENTFCSPRNLSQLAAASFGQTFTITPLQLITAVSACVNGGCLMQPYVVQRIVNPDGTTASERQPTMRRQVISEETSARVRRILEQVVGDPKEGTGRNAAVAGYRIGGKTGTSEKVSLEAQTGVKQYIVSFLGFAPADDPKIAVLVFLDTPSNASGVYVSGGQMAAPVVGNMLADILPYLGVEPVLSEDEAARADVQMPLLTGLSLTEAAGRVRDAQLRYRSIGSGDTVTDQLPAAGQSIARGTEIIVYLGAAPSQDTEILPDLTGMDYEQARDTLSYYGLYLRTASPVGAAGEQKVGGQSVTAGTALEHGSVITVTLIDSDETMLGIY